MLKDRISLYKEIEEKRKSKFLVYITSDRRNLESQIATDVLSPFTNHLDLFGDCDKITLFLYTRGGNTIAAWTLVNLIRNFCKDFEVIVPFHCHSAGTLICLGANNVIMTKQATLGPIDPSTNGPFNPQAPGNNPNARLPVSVEFVNSYFEMAKKDLKITQEKDLAQIYINLTNHIHPLALGQVFKSRSQIQMLAKKLLSYHKLSAAKETEIIKFLCSDSGSHDYTMHRDEVGSLGLHIEKPDEALYKVIKEIYLDIEKELLLTEPFDPKVILGGNANVAYSFRRGLIESIEGGCDVYISEGELTKQVVPVPPQISPVPQTVIQDNRTFDGWKHESLN